MIQRASVVIKSSLEATFSFTSNIDNLPLWGGVKEVRELKHVSGEVGSQYLLTIAHLLSQSFVTVEITKYTPFNEWAFKDISKPSLSEFHYLFEQDSADEETKVVLVYKQDANSAVNFVSKFTTKYTLKAVLKNLKKVIESQATRTTTSLSR